MVLDGAIKKIEQELANAPASETNAAAEQDSGSARSGLPSKLPLSADQLEAVWQAKYQDLRHMEYRKVFEMALIAITQEQRIALLEKDNEAIRVDANDDCKRLHADKMKYFERVIELERALQAIKDSPGGGPAKRIAEMALGRMK